MTFLEVVFAAALAAVLAVTFVGMFGFVIATQAREQRQLAAAEVANRLMLNYLDNPAAMPDQNGLIEYGPPENAAKYRWEISEKRVALREARPEGRDQTRASPLRRDRMKQVTIRVWLSEASGGSLRPGPSTPALALARLVDPLALRNPDSTNNMIKDPAAYQKWLESMMGFSGAQEVMSGGGPGGAGGGPALGNEGRATGEGIQRQGAGARSRFGQGQTARGRSPSWAYEQWGGPGASR